MEPLTHALTSVTLSRAGLDKATRLATPMLLVSGLAADIDALSRLGGARAYLQFNYTVTHSLLGTAVLVLAIAAVFWWFGRSHPTAPLRFGRAVLVCGAGALAHLLFDLTNPYGVQLLWPFRDKSYSWDLMEPVDPWVLILLVLGLLLPGLFRLVTEEIGAKPAARGRQRGAIAALVLVVLYCGARVMLHERALETLNSRMYRGMTPIAAEAFPTAASPFTWRGIVETENTHEEVDVPLAPGRFFDPTLSQTQFKPEPSAALEAARATRTAEEFVKFARFPKASVNRIGDGFEVQLRDMRFPAGLATRPSFVVIVKLDAQAQVLSEELRFAKTIRR